MLGSENIKEQKDSAVNKLLTTNILLVNGKVDPDSIANKQCLENLIRVAEAVDVTKFVNRSKKAEIGNQLAALLLSLRALRVNTRPPQALFKSGMSAAEKENICLKDLLFEVIEQTLKKPKPKAMPVLLELFTHMSDIMRVLLDVTDNEAKHQLLLNAKRMLEGKDIQATSIFVLDDYELSVSERRDEFFMIMQIGDFARQHSVTYQDDYHQLKIAAGAVASQYGVRRQERTLMMFINVVYQYIGKINPDVLIDSEKKDVARFGQLVAVIKELKEKQFNQPNFNIKSWRYAVGGVKKNGDPYRVALQDFKSDCVINLFINAIRQFSDTQMMQVTKGIKSFLSKLPFSDKFQSKEAALSTAEYMALNEIVNLGNAPLLVLTDKIVKLSNPNDPVIEKIVKTAGIEHGLEEHLSVDKKLS